MYINTCMHINPYIYIYMYMYTCIYPQGAFSFRLGTQADNIVPGIEEAISHMRLGELARITVSGRKGFDGNSFHGLARDWGIAINTSVVAEVEFVSCNTVDASGDGGVLVTFPHTSALEFARLRENSEWRRLQRRPSSHAHILLRCTLRAVHHAIPSIGNTTRTLHHTETHCNSLQYSIINTTTLVFPPAGDGGVDAPPEFSRWVALGKGELPFGMELAAVRTAVAGVPFSVRLTGVHTATHCNTLQHTTITHCNTLQHTATHCNTLQHTAAHAQHTHCGCECALCRAPYSTLQLLATHCNTLQRTATHCNTLQHTATHYITLQNTATHCNAPPPLPLAKAVRKDCKRDRECCSVLQCVVVCRSVLQCVVVCRSVLQCVAVCYSVLQCAAVCFSVL